MPLSHEFSLLTLRIWSSDALRNFVVNLTVASCMLIGLTHSFSLAAAPIQVFFVCMSVIGLIPRLRQSRPIHSRIV